jgi:hypothetical protein
MIDIMISSLKFLLYCIAVAIIYGIVHDQVTARVCVEYFTIGHPPIFHTDSPTLLAFGWGVLATWWGGLIIGLLLIASAGIGPWPRYPLEKLYRPVRLIMMIAAPVALIAGVAGYLLARSGMAGLPGEFAFSIPPEARIGFIADLWAHNASYDVAFAGGIGLAVTVMVKRAKIAAARRVAR